MLPGAASHRLDLLDYLSLFNSTILTREFLPAFIHSLKASGGSHGKTTLTYKIMDPHSNLCLHGHLRHRSRRCDDVET